MLQKCLLYRHIQSEIGEEDFCSFGCNLSLRKATKKAFYHPPIPVNYVYEALPLFRVWFHANMKRSWGPNPSYLTLIIISASYFPSRHPPQGSGCSYTDRVLTWNAGCPGSDPEQYTMNNLRWIGCTMEVHVCNSVLRREKRDEKPSSAKRKIWGHSVLRETLS